MLAHNPHIVTDSLVLYLDAANPKSYPGSGTIWYDLSGKGNNATLSTGSIGTVSSSLKTMSFNSASNDFATIADDSSLDPLAFDYTLDVWLKSTGVSGNIGYYYSHYGTPSGEIGIMAVVDDRPGLGGDASTRINDGGGGELSFDTEKDIGADGIWHNIVFSMERSVSGSAYQDGEYCTGEDISGFADSFASTNDVRIGRNIGGGAYFNGEIAIIRLYIGKALSQSEITQNFNAHRSRFSI